MLKKALWGAGLGLLVVCAVRASASPEERLSKAGIELPEPAAAIANYVPAARTGNLVFLAGHLPRDAAGKVVAGKVGDDIDEADAKEAARLAAIALLGTLKAEIGDLSRVTRVVRVGGYVNAIPSFTRHSQVIDGCSDLLVEIFGDAGRHTRVSAGMGSLPLNAAVEIEMIVEVRE